MILEVQRVSKGFLSQLDQTYENSRLYIKVLKPLESLEILKQQFILILPPNGSSVHIHDNSTWQEC